MKTLKQNLQDDLAYEQQAYDDFYTRSDLSFEEKKIYLELQEKELEFLRNLFACENQ